MKQSIWHISITDSKTVKISFLVWVLSIILFSSLITLYQSVPFLRDDFFPNILILVIAFGIVSFGVAIITTLRYIKEINSQNKKIEKRKERSDQPQYLVLPQKRTSIFNPPVIIFLIIVTYLLGKQQNFMGIANPSDKKAIPTSIIQIPTAISMPVKSETKIYPTADPNPVVNCGPFPNSKLTLKLKLSDCNNYTDCGFLDGKWIPMSKSECSKRQTEERARFTQSYQPQRGNAQTGGNIIPRQLTEEDYKKAGLIKCQTLTGSYWFTKEQCDWAQKGDTDYLNYATNNYLNQFNDQLNSAYSQIQGQQEAEKRKQECIQRAEQLFNELCNTQKKLDPHATCESIRQETERQKASCI